MTPIEITYKDFRSSYDLYNIYLASIAFFVDGLDPRMIKILAGLMVVCNDNRKSFFNEKGLKTHREIMEVDEKLIYTPENRIYIQECSKMSKQSYFQAVSGMRTRGIIIGSGIPNYKHPIFGMLMSRAIFMDDGLSLNIKLSKNG